MDELGLRAVEALPGSATLQHDGRQLALGLSGEVDAGVVQAFESVYGRKPLPVDAIDAGAVTLISAAGVALMLRFLAVSQTPGGPPPCGGPRDASIACSTRRSSGSFPSRRVGLHHCGRDGAYRRQ